MGLSFLTPAAAIVALLVAVPLVALLAGEIRAERVRRALGLLPPDGSRRTHVAALLVLSGLVGLGAAQPVLDRERRVPVREDAEVFFALDISRSMLAAAEHGEPNRFERAREAAKKLRRELRELPVGVASLTDRALPHLLPTSSVAPFEETVDRAVGVERPPPTSGDNVRATTFDALAGFATRRFFSAGAGDRLVVLFTDGESRPLNVNALRRALRGQDVGLVVLRFWDERERIFDRNGRPEAAYRSDPTSVESLAQLESTVGARVLEEDELDRAAGTVRGVLGSGGHVASRKAGSPTPLAAWFFAGAFAPLGFLLWRRNL